VTTEAAPATTSREKPPARDRAMRLPRTTGVASGVAIVILGLWGALIPFVGPYFHYAFGNYDTWHYTTNRLWLDIVPGALAVIGGVLLLRSATRKGGLIGGWMAVVAGGWFAIGPTVSLLWHSAGSPIGPPVGGSVQRMLELLGYFYGLGFAIGALAAFAMGRFVSRPRVAEEPFVAAGAVAGEVADHRRGRGGIFRRRRTKEKTE
jgi:hypothetical protein